MGRLLGAAAMALAIAAGPAVAGGAWARPADVTDGGSAPTRSPARA